MKRTADPIRKTDRHYTYRDYAEWPEEERWELIHGTAWSMAPAPSVLHQRIVAELSDLFRTAASDAGCEALFSPVDVMLFAGSDEHVPEADTVVQPDLFVVCDAKKLVDRGCIGAPDIVVEVLSSYTLRKDITVKRDLYERAGVREYWIVDPGNGAIMIYRLDESGRYPEDPELIQYPGTATSTILANLTVSLPFGSKENGHG